jgi:predicted O-methyltransferase YrrM
MTSRELTGLLPLPEAAARDGKSPWSDTAYRLAFGAIGWPWLLYSLWGGRRAEKARLLDRLGLDDHALPHLGSWKADTGFLHRIVDAIEELRPRTVVELGAGASTLVCAKALALHGGGRLVSYDQHAGFVEATAQWLESQGASAELRHAPLTRSVSGWPGQWYDLTDLPDRIDLLIIDGPPWTVHPFVRGAAESLFDRLSPGAVVLLDDAARPGERIIARRWRQRHPDIAFRRLPGSTKGTLAGRRSTGGQVIAFPARGDARPGLAGWRRAAAMLMLVGAGWIAHDATDGMDTPAEAAAFIDEASSSHSAGLARQRMASQLESTRLNRPEIAAATGIVIPALPGRWHVVDVQLYPTDEGMAVATVMRTDRHEVVTLFATRAETPAERNPLLGRSHGRAVAYWEAGELAYALTADIDPARLLSLAAQVATPG